MRSTEVDDIGGLVRWLQAASFQPRKIAVRLGMTVIEVLQAAAGAYTPATSAAEDLESYLWQLHCTVVRGAHQSKPTGRNTTCPRCRQAVAVILDQVDQLTSSGTGKTWSVRPAAMHCEACWTAQLAAPAKPTPDLWGDNVPVPATS